MSFKNLLDTWSGSREPERTEERYAIRLAVDDAARVQALADLYRGPSSIDALQKVAGSVLQVEHFHGQAESLVRQEISAHLSLIAMRYLFANQATGANLVTTD